MSLPFLIYLFIFITFVIFKYYKTWEHTLPEFSLFEWESPIEATENIILFPVGFASSAVLFQSRECRWETNKVFFMTIRKKYVVLRVVAWKTNKKKKTTTATISVGCVKPFCCSAFRPYFCAVAQCNTVGNSPIPLPKYGLSGVVVDW